MAPGWDLSFVAFHITKKKTTGKCCGRKSAQTQTLTNKYRHLFLSSHSQTLMHDIVPSQSSTPNPRFFRRSWAKLAQHLSTWGADSSARQIRDFSEHPCLLLFVVLPVLLWSPLMIIKPTGTRHMMLSVSQIWICLLAKSSLNKTEGGGCHCALLLLLTSQEGGGCLWSLEWIFLWICLISAFAYWNIPDFPQMMIKIVCVFCSVSFFGLGCDFNASYSYYFVF